MSYCDRGKARLSSLAGRNVQFRSDWSAIWVYNPRNGILMQHGFEESGDVQDIRLVVDIKGRVNAIPFANLCHS